MHELKALHRKQNSASVVAREPKLNMYLSCSVTDTPQLIVPLLVHPLKQRPCFLTLTGAGHVWHSATEFNTSLRHTFPFLSRARPKPRHDDSAQPDKTLNANQKGKLKGQKANCGNTTFVYFCICLLHTPAHALGNAPSKVGKASWQPRSRECEQAACTPQLG